MSKTKEEIYEDIDGRENPEGFVSVGKERIHLWLDEYADQKLEEYKERLKKSITDYQILDSTFKNAVFAIIDSL